MIVGVSLIQEIDKDKIDDISLTKFHLARKSDMTGTHDWYLHTKYPIYMYWKHCRKFHVPISSIYLKRELLAVLYISFPLMTSRNVIFFAVNLASTLLYPLAQLLQEG